MSAAFVFAVFGAAIALLWLAVFILDPDRRIAEAFDAAEVRRGDDLLAVADAVGVTRRGLHDQIAAAMAADLDAEWAALNGSEA